MQNMKVGDTDQIHGLKFMGINILNIFGFAFE